MGRDLEHAVGRGVDDGLARAHMLVAQPLDDLRARGVTVAEHSRQPAALDQLVEQRFRKCVLRAAEVAPVVEDGHAGHLPVPARRVLARAELGSVAVCAAYGDVAVAALGKAPAAVASRVQQSELREIRYLERPACASAAFGDVTQRVGADIAECVRVRRRSDPEGIQHEDDGAGHGRLRPATAHGDHDSASGAIRATSVPHPRRSPAVSRLNFAAHGGPADWRTWSRLVRRATCAPAAALMIRPAAFGWNVETQRQQPVPGADRSRRSGPRSGRARGVRRDGRGTAWRGSRRSTRWTIGRSRAARTRCFRTTG